MKLDLEIELKKFYLLINWIRISAYTRSMFFNQINVMRIIFKKF